MVPFSTSILLLGRPAIFQMLKYEVMPSLDRTIFKSNSHGLSSALEIKVETCSGDLQIDS